MDRVRWRHIMRTALLRAFPLLALVSCGREIIDAPEPAVTKWMERAPLPEALRYFGVTAYRGTIIVAGGVDARFVAQRAVYRFTPGTDVWTRLADLPTEMRSVDLVVAADTLFAVGGLTDTGKSQQALFAYDVAGDRWHSRAVIPDQRVDFAVAYAAGHIVLLGGPVVRIANEHGPRVPGDSVLAYRVATGTWHRRGLNPEPRQAARAEVLGDRIYIFGGSHSERAGEPITRVTVYQAAADSWDTAISDPLPSNLPHVARHGDRIHVIGGVRPLYAVGPLTMPDHRVLDLRTNTWTLLPDLPRGVVDAGLVAIGDTLWVMGGRVALSVLTRGMIALPLGR